MSFVDDSVTPARRRSSFLRPRPFHAGPARQSGAYMSARRPSVPGFAAAAMQDRQQPQPAASGTTQAGWRDHLASRRAAVAGILPGLLLCIAVTALAIFVQDREEAAFGHAWIEALVIAILLGIALRSFWQPGGVWRAGISFSAKTLLEIAVVLLGASISLGAVVASGPALLSGIVATVAAALA